MLIKILNKFLYYLKNIILPIVLCSTIYIVMFMFQRLEKEVFGANFVEFIKVLLPFIILGILSIINFSFHQEEVKNNFYYNITSFIVMLTIVVITVRTLLDTNMIFWHKYGYQMNFNFFADQLAAIKIMLYGLSIGNIILMIANYIKIDEDKNKKMIKK